MLNRVQVFGVAGLAALFFSGCGGSSDQGQRSVTFYVKGMGEKLKLL